MSSSDKPSIGWMLFRILFAAAAVSYGAYGVWNDDLYVPGKSGPGIHLHGAPAWTLFAAITIGCGNLVYGRQQKYIARLVCSLILLSGFVYWWQNA